MTRVFIVYGHDHKVRDEVTTMLEEFGLTPVLLSKTPDYGRTIIEKFEYVAKMCEFAIIILTPDDKNATELPKKDKFRARQNVIFEMGWFFARLGRRKTLLLHKGAVELPSDVTGVLHQRFSKSPQELRVRIREALVAGGIRVKKSLNAPDRSK